jgi:hypothetical protein
VERVGNRKEMTGTGVCRERRSEAWGLNERKEQNGKSWKSSCRICIPSYILSSSRGCKTDLYQVCNICATISEILSSLDKDRRDTENVC